ncbi:WD40-repeat-containing domain protein, partial [Lineolata rhizophorae]
PAVIRRDMLQGDHYDIQGIDWASLGTTREEARLMRGDTFAQISVTGAEIEAPKESQKALASTENFYRFSRMNTSCNAYIRHYQLRNLLVATSNSDLYYADNKRVYHAHPCGMDKETVMDFSRDTTDPMEVTALSGCDNFLIAGGYNGHYAVKNLLTEVGQKPTVGKLTTDDNGITNHCHTFYDRLSGQMKAAFCSNDRKLRILDCETNKFTAALPYHDPINCAATSPSGRLRAVVGDFNQTLITDATSGATVVTLDTHSKDVFAAAWAPDDITVATGAQDSHVVVHDGRMWARPLAVLGTPLSCPRSLAFTPAGSGPRALLAAEADDNVHAIEAGGFAAQQTLSFFGSVAGLAVPPAGDGFFVACSDPHFGGVLEYERT